MCNWRTFAVGLALSTAAFAQATAPSRQLLLPPDATAQNRAKALIHQLYQSDYAKTSPADHDALAKALLAQAPTTNDNSANRFQLFIEASDQAALAGDVETIVASLDGLGRLYEINIAALKAKALETALTAMVPDHADKVVEAALAAAHQAAATDDFTMVEHLTNLAEAAANRTKRVSVVTTAQPKIADLRALTAEYERAIKALETLKAQPDDKASHLTIGTFYALHKGQWEVGLPHLARGADMELARLAALELSQPGDPAKQVELADAWWNLSDSSPGPYRTILTAHAAEWYRKGRGGLTGLTLTRIDERLQTQAAGAATQPIQASTGVAAPLANPGPLTPALAVGTSGTVDLLHLIDPARDKVSGVWKTTGPDLIVANDKDALLQIPFAPPDEYDLTVSFTRTAGTGSLAFLLSSHRKSFGFALDVKGEARFERVANKIAKDNPTTVQVEIANGRPYTVKLEVRNDHITAYLDDKAITTWKTDYKDLARYAIWKMNDDALCGLGANDAVVAFHSIALTQINGSGKPTR